MNILNLSNELLLEIFKCVSSQALPSASEYEELTFHKGPEPSSLRLFPLLLVCRRFHDISEPLLYHTCAIYDTPGIYKFVVALLSRPHRQKYIRTITLSIPSSALNQDVPKHLMSLLGPAHKEGAEEWETILDQLISLVPGVNEFEIRTEFNGASKLIEALRDSPLAKKLTSFKVYPEVNVIRDAKYLPPYEGDNDRFYIAFSSITFFPSLQTLQLSGIDARDFDSRFIEVIDKYLEERELECPISPCREVVFIGSFLNGEFMKQFLRLVHPRKLWYSEASRLSRPGPNFAVSNDYERITFMKGFVSQLLCAKDYLEDLSIRSPFPGVYNPRIPALMKDILMEMSELKRLCITQNILMYGHPIYSTVEMLPDLSNIEDVISSLLPLMPGLEQFIPLSPGRLYLPNLPPKLERLIVLNIMPNIVQESLQLLCMRKAEGNLPNLREVFTPMPMTKDQMSAALLDHRVPLSVKNVLQFILYPPALEFRDAAEVRNDIVPYETLWRVQYCLRNNWHGDLSGDELFECSGMCSFVDGLECPWRVDVESGRYLIG